MVALEGLVVAGDTGYSRTDDKNKELIHGQIINLGCIYSRYVIYYRNILTYVYMCV